MEETGQPDSVNCPYCGATNSVESELCGACRRNLRIPKEARAEARARRLLAEAAGERAAALAAPAGRPAHQLWGRAALLAGLFYFYTRYLKPGRYYSPLDWLDLPFHEFGHILFGFLGRFMMFLGGTLSQLLVPALCLLHFRKKGANLSWQLCVFWLGQNLLNIAVYAGDAVKQELPLVGGGEHDWTYLLTETGLLAHASAVGHAFFLLGSAVIFYSFWLIGGDARARAPYLLGDFTLNYP